MYTIYVYSLCSQHLQPACLPASTQNRFHSEPVLVGLPGHPTARRPVRHPPSAHMPRPARVAGDSAHVDRPAHKHTAHTDSEPVSQSSHPGSAQHAASSSRWSWRTSSPGHPPGTRRPGRTAGRTAAQPSARRTPPRDAGTRPCPAGALQQQGRQSVSQSVSQRKGRRTHGTDHATHRRAAPATGWRGGWPLCSRRTQLSQAVHHLAP
jgi:hypothetical protein